MDMTSDQGGRMTIHLARAIAVLALIAVVATTVWPAGLGAPPHWATIPAVAKLALTLLGLSLVFETTRDLLLARRLAIASVVLGALVLISWVLTFSLGAENVLAKVGTQGIPAKWIALRPPALVALGVAALGASIAARRLQSEGFDASALFGTVAACALFLVCVGHLYGAAAITAGPHAAASTGLAAALLFGLSLVALALHPAGPLAVYSGHEPGAVAKRRLLPAAVLTPIASGFLLVYALKGQQLSPTLAVALTVFANVLVMLLLINVAGNKVARVVWDRQKRMEAREALVRKQGMRDALTLLLNRRGWDDAVLAGEKQCKSEGVDACVLVIDLDGLKQVNDTEGHKAGDAYIQRAAAALRKAARRGEPVARLGGDEFAYLVVGCDETGARDVMARFQEALHAGRVSASVGYAMRGEGTIAAAFESADAAMYQQKRARKLRRA